MISVKEAIQSCLTVRRPIAIGEGVGRIEDIRDFMVGFGYHTISTKVGGGVPSSSVGNPRRRIAMLIDASLLDEAHEEVRDYHNMLDECRTLTDKGIQVIFYGPVGQDISEECCIICA